MSCQFKKNHKSQIILVALLMVFAFSQGAMARIISGHIRTSGGTGVDNVKVTFEGLSHVYTNHNGYYFKNVSSTWVGTITPSKELWTFDPSVRWINSVGTTNIENQDFTGTPPVTRNISGFIRTSGGTGVADVTVSFTGMSDVTTDGAGFYSKDVRAAWVGDITPTKEWWTFDPASRTINWVSTADITGQDFTGTPPITRNVSGFIRTSDGTGIDEVTVSFTGQSDVTTDGTGFYSKDVKATWVGDITPIKDGYDFDPESRNINWVSTADITGQDFTGQQRALRKIFGTIQTTGAAGIADVTVSFSGLSSVVTDINGNYSKGVAQLWFGDITPSKDGWTFDPTNRFINQGFDDIYEQDFTGIPNIVIHGFVRTSDGAGLGNVYIGTDTGEEKYTTDDGSYYLSVPNPWTGRVTPVLAGYTMDPQYRDYSNVTSDMSNQNYVATQQTGGTGFWADIDGDGDVDIIDVQLVAARWNTAVGDPNYDPTCDVDNEGQGDGDIDIIDVQLVAAWWNQPIPPG